MNDSLSTTAAWQLRGCQAFCGLPLLCVPATSPVCSRLLAFFESYQPNGLRSYLQRKSSHCRCQSPQQQSVGAQLIQNYHRFQKPAKYNVMFSKALKEFTVTAILAYECGYSEDLIRDEVTSTGGTVLGNDFQQVEMDECVLAVVLVWITLAMLPRATSKRWATGQAVNSATYERWCGFVRLIVKGYFEKRWAAYPIDRLQAEISLMTGRLERPSTVAEWSRLVFAALETAAPQWPSK